MPRITCDTVARMLAGGPPLWLASGAAQPVGDDVGAVVESSGSTGVPKPIELRREALVAAAQANRDHFGWDATWHLALPARYVAGLMVLVRGALGAGVRECRPDLRDLTPASGRNCLSIVPTQLLRALDAGVRLDTMDAVLVGGAPLTEQLRHRAKAARIPVVETYGMSETCGGIVYDGVPLPGVEVTLEGERIRVSGPMVQGGSLLTNDRGEWRDGRLAVLGRIDDLIITGGLKADLRVVRDALQAKASESWALAVDDEEWGQRIVAFVPHGTLEQWRAKLAPVLPRHALPRQVVVVENLPRTTGGKPDREKLLGLLGS